MTEPQPDDDALLTPAEVAAMFGVSPKTVTRWARAGRLPAIKTLGGHRRFRLGDVRTAMGAQPLAEARHLRAGQWIDVAGCPVKHHPEEEGATWRSEIVKIPNFTPSTALWDRIQAGQAEVTGTAYPGEPEKSWARFHQHWEPSTP